MTTFARTDEAQPAVSIIIPCHDYAEYVGAAIESVLSQTLRNREVIVIDDASTDCSWDVLQRYRAEPGVRLVRERANQGYVRTYRRGMEMARGRALVPLDADDLVLNPDALRLELELLDADERVAIVHSAYVEIDADGRRLREHHPARATGIVSARDAFRPLVLRNRIQHSGTLIRRSAYMEVGGYDASLMNPIDWDLWLRLTRRYAVGYVDQPLFAYRIHGRNMHREIRADESRRRRIEREILAVIDRATAEDRRLRSAARAEAHAVMAAAHFAAGHRREGTRSLCRAIAEDPRVAVRSAFLGAFVRGVAAALGRRMYASLTRIARRRP